MSTRKTFLSVLVTGAIAFQFASVAYADVTIDGQVYTDEWIAAHPTEVANYIQQNPENAAAIAASANSSTQTAIYNAYQRSTGSTMSLTDAQNWANQTAAQGGATLVTVGNQSYSNAWIAAHPQEVADYLKNNPTAAANVLRNASQTTINLVLADYNNINKTTATTQQAKDWINQNANKTSTVTLKNPANAPMTIMAIYGQPTGVNYSGGSGIYTPQGQEISKQQIADFFNTNPTNTDIAMYALKVGLNQYQVANALAQWQGKTYHAPIWIPDAGATIGGSAGGASQVGLTTATGGTGAWGTGACGGAGWGGSAWTGGTAFGGYDTCRNGSNMGSYGGGSTGNTGGNNSNNSTVVGVDGKTYTCMTGRAFTAASVVTDGITSGFCTVVSSTGGATGGTTGGGVGTGGATGSLPHYTVVGTNGTTYSCLSMGPAFVPETVITSNAAQYCTVVTGGTTGNQQTQSSPQPLSDLDPNATSGSCLTLTSTTLRYQAKDADNNGEVTTLQTFLNDNSYLTTAPTGFFGAGTLKAVKAFQVANNLNPTGYVGPNTRAAIKTISCNSAGTGSATLNDNNAPVTSAFPAGCTSSTGFSRTTGLSCASAFPAGCDSASGFSVTTGAKCTP